MSITTNPFNKLPDELVTYLFQFLSARDNAAVSRTCQRFYRVAKEDLIWRSLAQDHFGGFIFTEAEQALSWKEKFRILPALKMVRDLTDKVDANIANFMKKFMEFAGKEITSWTLCGNHFIIKCLSTNSLTCDCGIETNYFNEKELKGEMLNERNLKIRFTHGFQSHLNGNSENIEAKIIQCTQGLGLVLDKEPHHHVVYKEYQIEKTVENR